MKIVIEHRNDVISLQNTSDAGIVLLSIYDNDTSYIAYAPISELQKALNIIKQEDAELNLCKVKINE